MNKIITAAAAAGLMISTCLPALADSDKSSTTETKVKTTKNSSKTSNSKGNSSKSTSSSDDINFGDVVNGLSFTGARLVKFTVGMGVGAPVAMFRKTLRQTHDSSKNVAGDHNQACYLLSQMILLPTVGVFVGGLDGISWSAANSWKNSDEVKPFNLKKEMFSLGSLEE